MMNCKSATRMASDAMERDLSLKERILLRLHVLMCSGCHNFAEQMNILRNIGRSYAKGNDGATNSDNAKAADDKPDDLQS